MDHMAPVVAEQRFTGRTDAELFLQGLAAAHGDPGALGSKAFHMILLLLEQRLGDQHGHGYVFMSQFLELSVQNILYVFPDRVSVGTEDEQSLYAGIIHQFGFGADVGEPLGKVDLHVGDLFHFFLFGHIDPLLTGGKRNPPN